MFALVPKFLSIGITVDILHSTIQKANVEKIKSGLMLCYLMLPGQWSLQVTNQNLIITIKPIFIFSRIEPDTQLLDLLSNFQLIFDPNI